MAMMNQEQLLSRSENVSMRTINFAYDRSDLSNASKDTLQRNAQLLRTSSTMKVTVEGHADERGTTAYNLRLGKNRALAAADYLISLGIPPERISSVSCGEKCPLDTQHNELAWAANRRVEFKDTGRD
jgi:peptidoglycan-associated lipoprotein